jgi:hypothetical protein
MQISLRARRFFADFPRARTAPFFPGDLAHLTRFPGDFAHLTRGLEIFWQLAQSRIFFWPCKFHVR